MWLIDQLYIKLGLTPALKVMSHKLLQQAQNLGLLEPTGPPDRTYKGYLFEEHIFNLKFFVSKPLPCAQFFGLSIEKLPFLRKKYNC
jgi:hypothetical protein